jgi:HSP20 family molecular chaperone IbpA
MKLNKTHQSFPLALSVGSFLDAMDSSWHRNRSPKGFDSKEQPQFTDCNISENCESFELKFLLPGFEKEDVSVTMKDSEITVNASLRDSENNSIFGKKEFCRVLEIPESCEKRKVRAKLDKGILHLVLPKRKAVKPIEIKIN